MKWQAHRLAMGTFALDGGAMFGIVPKPLWEKAYPSDARNRITMQTSCMLLIGHNKKVIVEAGCGWSFNEKEREFYAMDKQPSWQEVLAPLGVKVEQITDVIVTHLHFDHSGGLSRKLANGEYVLSFPQATHYVQSKQLNWARNPSERDRGSYREDGTYPFFSENAITHLLDGDVQILPGICAQVINGHSPGQQLIHIDAEMGHLVFNADLCPTTAHLHLPWIMGYDLFPLDSLKEKKTLLNEVVNQQWILWLYHDLFDTAVKVKFDGKRFQKSETLLSSSR